MAFSFLPVHQNDDAITIWSNQPPSANTSKTWTSYFKNSYGYLWDTASLESMRQLTSELNAEQQHNISFSVPQLWCWGCYSNGEATRLFEMNTLTTVTRTLLYNGNPVADSTVTVATKNSGATSIPDNNDSVWYGSMNGAYLRTINDYVIAKKSVDFGYVLWDKNEFDQHYDYAPMIANGVSSHADKTITFTTATLSVAELESGYSYIYNVHCRCNAVSDGMLQYYEKKADYTIHNSNNVVGTQYYASALANFGDYVSLTDPSVVTVTASFLVANKGNEVIGTPFLTKGVKYNAYDLLRRALLTVDTKIIDNVDTGLDELVLNDNDIVVEQKSIEHSIVVDPLWRGRMQAATVQETIFEGKNLWEVLLQIGYYMHAIPYLEFATDGTDRFVLKFRQLGDTKVKEDGSVKSTIFTSKNLQDYFTQYDAYVTNLFSPQNVIEEWLCVKTSDSSHLVYNDVAELITSKPILEVVELDVIYDGHAGGTAGTKSILTYIFEESVYNILTSDDPEKIRPAKGNAIYYSLADNKIQGLQYTPPSVNSGSYCYALQQIIAREFGAGTSPLGIPSNIKYNNLRFRIKYRTQDSLRVSQVRPDITNFMKNSAYEEYPHHEQFYGQQDKIVDSERFSANLFGKLIRVGNNVYQCTEYALTPEQEKEAGDLVTINNEAYYVMEVENELYNEAIFQKVKYSKNFNQLSNIVVIPAEPRFYEVSERSKIRREVRIMEFFELSTEDREESNPKFIPSDTWQSFITSLIFTKNRTIPNFAYTKFIADSLRRHKGSFSQVVTPDKLFPSSDIDRTTDPNSVQPMPPRSFVECVVPLLHYPLHDGIVFEWDMEDNFKAGDFVDTSISGDNNTANNAYYALQSLRYVDIMGRADLFRFILFNKTNWTTDQIQILPKAKKETVSYSNNNPIWTTVLDNTPTQQESIISIEGNDTTAIALDKDNREMLSFNYQINLLHKANEADDDFITFSNLFGDKDNDLQVLLLADPQSQFNENINITPSVTLADNVPFTVTKSTNNNIQITFDIDNIVWQNNGTIEQVKCICFYQENVDTTTGINTGSRTGYIYKNVTNQSNKLKPWYIYPTFNS